MGLSAGGRMTQEIYQDAYGADAWDQSVSSRCFVSMLDAAQWRAVTGESAPTKPPSQADYAKAGLPWFDYYAPERVSLEGSAALAGVKSWGVFKGLSSALSATSHAPVRQPAAAERPKQVQEPWTED
jgi:hypothetical protein